MEQRTQTYEEQVRQVAHEMWEREGRPEGKEKAHWQQAEEIIQRQRQSALQVESDSFAEASGPAPTEGASGQRPVARADSVNRRVRSRKRR
jgi:hypothetical protein